VVQDANFYTPPQRYPDRESHGLATEDKAGTETQGDVNATLYYHRIGTPQCKFHATVCNTIPWTLIYAAEDILVMKDDENPEWIWGVDISEVDGRYLALYIAKDTAMVRFQYFPSLLISY